MAPQLYGSPGGVQTYMRRLREICSVYSNARNFGLCTISLNDVHEDPKQHEREIFPGAFEGCAGSKVSFVLRALHQALKHPGSLLIVGHIGQAPVAWLLKKLGLIQSYILVLHGIEAWEKVEWLDRVAANDATCIVTTTQYTASAFCQSNGIPQDRSFVIHLCLGDDFISHPPQYDIEHEELRVLTVARLSVDDREKGIDDLIMAVAKLHAKDMTVHLTIVGDGVDARRLKDLARKLRLNGSNSVSFLGFVPHETLQKLYEECAVFAMPSKKEGFGIVFLEAMRYGKPCIGGNHGGIPEVITHGVDGYLVEHGRIDQLMQCLEELYQNPQLRQQMGRRGYEKVIAKHLFPHMKNEWFLLLDRIATL